MADRVFTFGAEGVLTCLELETGKLVWKLETADKWRIPEAFFGVGSSPVLEDGRLLVMIGGQPNSGMAALDPATGKVLWESVGEKNWQGAPMSIWPGERRVEWNPTEKQASYATPVIASVHGKKRAFCFMRQGLVALDPATGAVDFSYWFRSQATDSVNAMSPVVVDDTVLISSAYYKTGSALLKIGDDLKSFTPVWRGLSLEIHWNTPVYHEGFLYAFSGRNEPDAHFRCVEFKTGKVTWDVDERWMGHSTPSPTYGRGSAILADGRLIVTGEAGFLGMYKLNPEKPEEICRCQVPQLQYPCWAGPALSRKRLYLRSEKALVCFNLAPPAAGK
jgi:outer membrane protein assembly factor BamB